MATKRQRVKPGFSMMAWNKLMRSTGGRKPRASVSLDEVARHAAEGDFWTVLDGRVYDLTSESERKPVARGTSFFFPRRASRRATPDTAEIGRARRKRVLRRGAE